MPYGAAATLTCQAGVGVDALCKAAGVSKRSMYQLFESKDELLTASLEERITAFAARLLPAADDGRPPRERILHVFEQVESQAGVPEFRGCDPDLLAKQLSLTFDGAVARAGIRAENLAGLIEPTVGALLDSAGMR